MPLSPRVKKMIAGMLIGDAIVIVVAGSIIYRRAYHSGGTSGADVKVEIRHIEPTLTEIDLVNHGSDAGVISQSINAHWNEAELKESEPLPGFENFEARHSVVFHPKESGEKIELKAGESRAIGWVKLTDDSPVLAEFTDHVPATEP